MSMMQYNRDKILEFCSRENISDIIYDIKEKWIEAVVYVPQANVMEIRVWHEEANISDIVDIVLENNPGWNRERFLRGGYGFFINETMTPPCDNDVVIGD